MSSGTRSPEPAVQPLRATDLGRVVEIDRAHTGIARGRFFEKRLRAAEREPEEFIHLCTGAAGSLAAYALARVQRGEFGREEAVIVLDAMGVAPGSQEQGHGRAMLRTLGAEARRRGIRRLLSQADWRSHHLLRFFDHEGFEISARMVLERSVGDPLAEPAPAGESGEAAVRPERSAEIDYSVAQPDFGPLARDRVPVRSMMESDLRALTSIDRQITGHNRGAYFERKLREALRESDVRVSLVAELEQIPAGFIMARVDLGAFGRTESAAMLDTIGVAPDYRDRSVGRALLSQLLANLASLRVEKLLTEVEWSDRDLMGYLASCGFRPSTRLCFDYRIG